MRVLGWTIGCVAISILSMVMLAPTAMNSISGFLALTFMMGALFLLWLERITAPKDKNESKSDRAPDKSHRAYTEPEPKNHTTRDKWYENGKSFANKLMREAPSLFKCSLTNEDYHTIGCQLEQAGGKNSAKIHIRRLAQLERWDRLDGGDGFADEFEPESEKERREIITEGAMIANAIMQKHPELSKCSLRVRDYYIIGLLSENKYVDPKEYLVGIVRSQRS